MSMVAIIAAAFVAAEGGEALRLFQTTETKDFREVATSGFTIHPYPAVKALDVDTAKEKHEFLALGASLTDASAWVLANMPAAKRVKVKGQLLSGGPMPPSALREAVGIKSRIHFHFSRYYMTPLMEKGLVERTDPENPMSPRQENKLA